MPSSLHVETPTGEFSVCFVHAWLDSEKKAVKAMEAGRAGSKTKEWCLIIK